ncbi:MAG: hypothetical protein GY946_30945 [bacterium]|nr:hypothetical protein [bacterium]
MSWRKGGRARIRLVGEGSQERRWELAELDRSPFTVGHIELPFPMAPERADYRADVAARIKRSGIKVSSRQARRQDRRRDPRADLTRAEQEVESLQSRARRDKRSIAVRFDAICGVLRDRGHLHDWEVTESGRRLGRIYHEVDLLITDALGAGLFDHLNPPQLASLASCFTYEHRSAGPPPDPWFPSQVARKRFRDLERLASELAAVERHHGVPQTRDPDGGFAAIAHSWAAGEDLGVILGADDDLSAGDFVRNVKQLIDLLRQIATAAPRPATASAAREAADAIHRGVVALSGAVDEQ